MTIGPYETEREAIAAVRHILDSPPSDRKEGSLRLLMDTLAGAGVGLGAYDERIAGWLAGWEPQTVAVIAGWVERACEAGTMRGTVTRVPGSNEEG